MALIDCPECLKPVSDHAAACPHCGFPVVAELRKTRAVSLEEEGLFSESPKMFANNPLGFVICCVLCLALVGFVFLFFWWLECRATVLTVTGQRSILRRGILSKRTNEVRHEDVRNIQVGQSFLQRMFDVGSLAISSAGQGEIEIEISGIADPQKVADLIRAHQ
jgi:uncharacterized membrane protein YdbT with pleckstrin-like domain